LNCSSFETEWSRSGAGWNALTHLGFLPLADSSSRIDILYIIDSLFRLAKFKLIMYDDSNFDQLFCIWRDFASSHDEQWHNFHFQSLSMHLHSESFVSTMVLAIFIFIYDHASFLSYFSLVGVSMLIISIVRCLSQAGKGWWCCRELCLAAYT
jgi:hypothetical protein